MRTSGQQEEALAKADPYSNENLMNNSMKAWGDSLSGDFNARLASAYQDGLSGNSQSDFNFSLGRLNAPGADPLLGQSGNDGTGGSVPSTTWSNTSQAGLASGDVERPVVQGLAWDGKSSFDEYSYRTMTATNGTSYLIPNTTPDGAAISLPGMDKPVIYSMTGTLAPDGNGGYQVVKNPNIGAIIEETVTPSISDRVVGAFNNVVDGLRSEPFIQMMAPQAYQVFGAPVISSQSLGVNVANWIDDPNPDHLLYGLQTARDFSNAFVGFGAPTAPLAELGAGTILQESASFSNLAKATRQGYDAIRSSELFASEFAPQAGVINLGKLQGSGAIDYGSINSLGQRTGVNATITEEMLGTGTPANPAIAPPGWSGNGLLSNEARGHLLGRQLGGSGTMPENLVTLSQNPVNSPVMRGFENQVAAAVRNGEVVQYSSTPIYFGNSAVPRAITLTGTGTNGFNLNVSVLNPMGLPR